MTETTAAPRSARDPEAASEPDAALVEHLFHSRYAKVAARTDRVFAWLMVLQWVAGIVISLVLSPRTWAGYESAWHLHVYAAVFLGATLSALPIAMTWARPGGQETRFVIAVAQAGWSALLIHLTGGRIETHFHIFGSLAMLAFYRDPKVLVPATVVVAADHFLRGLYWPESIYGVANPEWWRFLEHAGWVLFIDLFLVVNCIQSRRELWDMSHQTVLLASQREAQIAAAKFAGEQEARAQAHAEHSAEVERAFSELSDAHDALRTMQRQLVDASRQAGIAEIATDVLHNVGNALNSVNVSVGLVDDGLRALKVDTLDKLASLLEAQDDLGRFVTEDRRGRRLTAMVRALATAYGDARAAALGEVESLVRHVDHIKGIVRSQQQVAKVGGAREAVEIVEAVEAAIELQHDSLLQQGIEVERCFEDPATVYTDRHRLVQILTNLLSNARHAIRDLQRGRGRITIRVARYAEWIRISVSDDGPGVPAGLAERIFQHGFTTKADGHGFGLHGSANQAAELGGRLSLEEPVLGRGATFYVDLPRETRTAHAA